jgi:hypothetical protein
MDQLNLPSTAEATTTEEVRQFFDRFFEKQVTFPSAQIDAVVGFFEKRGFDEISSKSTAITLLNQAKLDNISPFKLLDSLKGLTTVQLSQVVTEVLNSYREKTSVLGFKVTNVDETTESRNIRI